MSNSLLTRLTRLRADVFLAADTLDVIIRAAYGPGALVASGPAHEDGTRVAIVEFEGSWHGLWVCPDLSSSEESWESPVHRFAMSYRALDTPHVVSSATVQDFIEALARNDQFIDMPEVWPSGHLLRLLLGTLPDEAAEDMLLLLGMGWPEVAQTLGAQARLVTA